MDNTYVVVIIIIVLIVLFFGNRLRGGSGRLPGAGPTTPMTPQVPREPQNPRDIETPKPASDVKEKDGGEGTDDLLRDLKGSDQKKQL